MLGSMILVNPLIGRIVMIAVLFSSLVLGALYINHQGYQRGYAAAQAEGRAEMDAYKVAQAKAIADITAKNRAEEERLATQILQDHVRKEIEIQAINEHHQRVLSSLRERAPRNPPKPDTSKDPTAAAPQCAGTGSTGAELSREDAEFLVGEAAGADTLREALKSCRRAYERLLTEPKEKQ